MFDGMDDIFSPKTEEADNELEEIVEEKTIFE